MVRKYKIIPGTQVIIENREIPPSEIQEVPLIWLDFCLNEQYGYAICIDGISDNKEEYMLNHFKV